MGFEELKENLQAAGLISKEYKPLVDVLLRLSLLAPTNMLIKPIYTWLDKKNIRPEIDVVVAAIENLAA